MIRPKTGAAVALVLAMLPLSGCVTAKVANMMVRAPNQQHVPAIIRNRPYAAKYDALYTRAWRVPVGPPAAELSVAVIEPGDYHLKHEVVFTQQPDGGWRFSPKIDWVAPPASSANTPVVKGTIVLLPGYMETKEDVVHWALRLAESGYRAVLVDLRGQGRSSGPWIGYGAFEAHDLMQLLDDLQAKGLATGKVGVLGISYGASMALLWAARDPRVGAVVALEPFSNAEQAMKELGRATLPQLASLVSDAGFAKASSRAAEMAGFSWRDTDVLAAVEHLRAPTLYFHGGDDDWISPEHSRRLFAHTAGVKALGILEHDNHILLAVRLDPIADKVLEWYGKWLRPDDGRVNRQEAQAAQESFARRP